MMRLFCYGTLQFPAIMRAVCGHTGKPQPATLEGYACQCLRDEVFPGIVASPAAVTSGVLYDGVGRRRLARLDRYESDLYRRRRVAVTVDGRRVQAWAYVVAYANRARVAAAPWDVRTFTSGHLDDYLRRGRRR